MSAPLGTFNSEERVQISTAIRLARQLLLSNSLFLVHPVLSFYSPFALSLSFPLFASLRNRERIAFGICAGDFESR